MPTAGWLRRGRSRGRAKRVVEIGAARRGRPTTARKRTANPPAEGSPHAVTTEKVEKYFCLGEELRPVCLRQLRDVFRLGKHGPGAAGRWNARQWRHSACSRCGLHRATRGLDAASARRDATGARRFMGTLLRSQLPPPVARFVVVEKCRGGFSLGGEWGPTLDDRAERRYVGVTSRADRHRELRRWRR